MSRHVLCHTVERHALANPTCSALGTRRVMSNGTNYLVLLLSEVCAVFTCITSSTVF